MDYPNMWGYVRDLYQTSGIGETVDAEHIQKHYQVNKYLQLENQEFSFWRVCGHARRVNTLLILYFFLLLSREGSYVPLQIPAPHSLLI